MNLSQAIKYANRIVELLSPHCEKVNVAGSIRRQKEDVGDIEIICLPKRKFTQTDLFGGGEWEVTAEFESAVSKFLHSQIKGNVNGRYMQMYIKSDPPEKLDLFMPAPEDYYRQLAIRTGSSLYSNLVIAHSWKKLGWVGTGEHGLRRKEDCQEILMGEKSKWKLINPDGERPPVWTSEQEFFSWIGVKWIHPHYREIKEAINK